MKEFGTVVIVFSVKSSYGQKLNRDLVYKDIEPLEDQLGKIILDLFITSNKLDVLEEIESRIMHRKWEEEERLRNLEKVRKIELDRVSKLESIVLEWDKAQKIREFADKLEGIANKIIDDADRREMITQIEWIREKADWIDPLVLREDKLLGKRYDGYKI